MVKEATQSHSLAICSDMNRAFPYSLYTHLVPRSRALSDHPKKRGDGGGIPPLLGLFLEGDLVTTCEFTCRTTLSVLFFIVISKCIFFVT